MVKIGEPTNIAHTSPFLSGSVLPISRIARFIGFRNSKRHIPKTKTKPNFVGAYQRKNLLISNGILVSNNQKLLIIFHQLRHIFPKERERRVGHDNVRLAQQFNALLRTKVARLQLRQHVLVVFDEDFHVGHIHCAVAIHVLHLRDDQFVGNAFRFFLLFLPLGEQREFAALDGRAVVARANQFFQSELIETRGEVFEEIAFVGVIAVAKHGFAAEVLPIVLQLAFDVLQLRVELILLRHLSGVKIFVCHEKRLIE